MTLSTILVISTALHRYKHAAQDEIDYHQNRLERVQFAVQQGTESPDEIANVETTIAAAQENFDRVKRAIEEFDSIEWRK